MTPATLLCPQCGSPLPRQALWRTVTCRYCAADVTRSEDLVRAADFHAAWLRSRTLPDTGSRTIACAGHHYKTIAHLGTGASARLVLADRVGALPQRVVLKIAHAGTAPGKLAREKDTLDELQADASPGAAYFTQRLPQPVALGRNVDPDGQAREILVLRHPTGFWGSLADVRQQYGRGIDPRHAVWMWRRVLEVLAHIHTSGWAHGRLAPEHLLVHPNDHGILIVGWSGAERCCRDGAAVQARDLMQSAWAMRAMLSDAPGEPVMPRTIPQPLARLLERASTDSSWCKAHGADGIREALGSAAHESFGPSTFIHFSPTPSITTS